ncbi:hypothetical protein P692DRAFT_20823768 [Suillus brevipes Sb2]|nr:hypothetical protein P692DRAFT_20823768 [Suillus brevipes Sb2]
MPMGQWKPSTISPKQREQRRLRQIWNRAQKVMEEQAKEEKYEHSRTVGSERLPSREVVNPPSIHVLVDANQLEYEGELLGELPELQPQEQDIHTRHMWPDNSARVAKILLEVKLGDDITEDEKRQLEDFIRRNVDVFALSIKEVKPIPGAYVNLNVPEAATFNL